MADRIVVMHDGLVEQIGAPLELYDRPDNLFVAGFIGSPAMNFLRGTIRLNGSASFAGPNGLTLPLDAAPAGTDGKPAVYGIRPEHFTIADDGAEAEVQVVEPTGSELHVVAKLGGEDIIAVFRERHQIQAGRQDPAQARSAARASVRRADRKTTERDENRGGSDHDHVHPPHPRAGRHRGCRDRRAGRLRPPRMGEGLGPDRAVEARERRAALDAALEVLRAIGGRRVRASCSTRSPRRPASRSMSTRESLRGHSAESLGGGEYQRRPGSVLGPVSRCRTCFRRNASTSPTSPIISARNTAAGSPTAEAYGKSGNNGSTSRSATAATC